MPEYSLRYLAGALLSLAMVLGGPPSLTAQATPPPDTARPPLETSLQPGDVVRLTVWREPDFTGEFPVDAAGHVVLPRIGMMDVAGKPASALRQEILDGLGRYLRNPSIDVVFLRRITIYGAVQRSGLYPVDPTMTILDALALAGGARYDGRLDRIRLLRGGEEIATIATTSTRIDELPIRSGDQLFVPEQSWARRNSGLLATFISAGVTLAVAFIYTSQ